MNLEQFPERWHEAIKDIAAQYSIAQPAPFDPSVMFQPPEDFLVWAPDEMPDDPETAIDWLCKRVGGFMFVALPWKYHEQPQAWKDLIEKQLTVRDWVVFDHGGEKLVVGSAMRFQDWRIGNVVGAMSREERLAQIKHNMAHYKARPKLAQPENRKAIVIMCYGPSIHSTWRGAISEARFLNADIATNSGAHDFLIKKGVIPHYHVEIDPREERAEFTDQPQKEGVEYLIASVCSPKLTDKLAPFNMKVFHLNDGSESRSIFDYEPDAILIDGGASVALRSMSLFYSMGYRYFSIYGFDCSFREEMQWAGEHPGKRHKVIEATIEGVDRKFKTSVALLTYAKQFREHVNMLPDAKFFLHGDGLLQQWCMEGARRTAMGQAAE